MKNRRVFLQGIGGVGLWTSATLPSARGSRFLQPEIVRERTKARLQRRPIIWNNDGSDIQSMAYAGGKWPIPLESVEQFWDGTLRFLEGTSVATILYCARTNEPDWEFPKKYIELLGPNPVQHVVDFAHKHHKEFFYSIRMNDVHCSRYAPKAGYWSSFKLAHPELLLGYISRTHWEEKIVPWLGRFMPIEEQRWKAKLYHPEKETELLRQSEATHPLKDVFQREGVASRDLWFWGGYDWARAEVRARYLQVIEGACERYDLDGVELDWARHYGFFKLGQERRNISVMNDFVHQVRQRLDYYGERRGRPILLASGRTPDSLELSLSLGLDPETWARKGWIDLLLAGSGGMPFTMPIEEWVALGHRYDVPVYGCLDRIYVPFQTGRPKWDVRDPEMEGGLASNYEAVDAASYRFWEAGADGICLYDWHTHHGPTNSADYGKMPSIEDPKALARRNKVYRIDPGYARLGCLADGCLASQLPRAFSTQAGQSEATFQLKIADDPTSASEVFVQAQYSTADSTRPPAIASWDLERAEGADRRRFKWELNGVSLSEPVEAKVKRYGGYGVGWIADAGWVEFKIDPRNLKKGKNTLRVTVEPPPRGDPAEPVQIVDVRIRLGYS